MPNCLNCGTEIQITDKFCRECGKSLTAVSGNIDNSPLPPAIEPKQLEAKLSPAEMIEFQKWQKTVRGVTTTQTASNKQVSMPQQAGELAKTTGDIFRSFREISDGLKKDLRDVTNISSKPSTSATTVAATTQTAQAPQKPQLSPEEMIEFNKWRQSFKGTSEQPE